MHGGLKEREENKMRKTEIMNIIESIYRDACKTAFIDPAKEWETFQDELIDRDFAAATLTEAERACRKLANAAGLGAWLDLNMIKWADEVWEQMA